MNILNMAVDFFSKRKRRAESSDKRSRTMRSYAIGSILVFIAILIVFNLLFEIVFGNKLVIDFSDAKMNTIGSKTKEVISQLDSNVEVIGLFEEPTNLESSIYKFFVPLLNEYEDASNGKLTTRYIDPVTHPSILKEIDPNNVSELSQGTFVIKYMDKIRVIEPYECFIFDQYLLLNYDEYSPISNNIEMIFTGTIMNLLEKETKSIYFLSNHQEAGHKLLDVILGNNGFQTFDITLSGTDPIPEDCSILFVIQPLQDITQSESEIIIEYLSTGGKLIVVNDINTVDISYDNLNKVLQYMNISMTDSLIFENDPSYIFDMTNVFISRGIITEDFSALVDSTYVTISYSRNIDEYDNPTNEIVVSPMIQSSDIAILEIAGEKDTSGATAGKHNAAMYSSRNGENGYGEIIVLGTQLLTSDEYYYSVGLNDLNAKFMSSIVQKLSGEEFASSVESKEFPNYALSSVPTVSENTIFSVTLVAIIPLLFLVIAAIVYNKRKHL